MRFDPRRMFNLLTLTVAAALALLLALGGAVPAAHAQDADPCGESVTVQEGDTLIEIATRCNTTVNAILEVNPGVDPRALAIGTELTMPTDTFETGSANIALAIAPAAGPPGTQVRVIANNLVPNAPVEIGIGRPNSEYDVIAQTSADGFGTVSQLITVPDYIGQDLWVVVLNNPENDTELLSSDEQPVVAIAPTQGMPGSSIQTIANDFPANTEVDIGVGLWGAEYDVTQRLTTDEFGTVQASVTIPEFATGDEQWVVVVATADGSVITQSARFNVTADPGVQATDTPVAPAATSTPIASPTALPVTVVPTATSTPMTVPMATATQVPEDAPVSEGTSIYMIALGDAGESGSMMACGDSVVAIQIPVAPTDTPLNAALENLLTIRDEFYGESGLYNALHASELSLNALDVENGHATIRINGIMRETRLCDWQRIKAQIMQTALQYDEVNSVSLFLNGNQM